MKVTALGVHGAFSVGEVEKTIDRKEIQSLLAEYEDIGDFSLLSTEVQRKSNKKVYVPKFQSNFLLEFDAPGKISKEVNRFVIDFGSDIRHSLAFQGFTMNDIDSWYCSHPHADHMGGVEGIALSTFFNPYWNEAKKQWQTELNLYARFPDGAGFYDAVKNTVPPIADKMLDGKCQIPSEGKPTLYGHHNVIRELWKAAEAGLNTLQGIRKVELETYFEVIQMYNNKTEIKFKDGDREWTAYTIVSTHVLSGGAMMPSYGLFFECSDGQKIYFPTDSQIMAPPQLEIFYKKADVVYQDCETTPFRSNVHPNIEDLKELTPEIKEKLYLYHYQDTPDSEGFKGVLETGQVHEY